MKFPQYLMATCGDIHILQLSLTTTACTSSIKQIL